MLSYVIFYWCAGYFPFTPPNKNNGLYSFYPSTWLGMKTSQNTPSILLHPPASTAMCCALILAISWSGRFNLGSGFRPWFCSMSEHRTKAKYEIIWTIGQEKWIPMRSGVWHISEHWMFKGKGVGIEPRKMETWHGYKSNISFRAAKAWEFTNKLKFGQLNGSNQKWDWQETVFLWTKTCMPIQLQYHTITNLNSTKHDFQFAWGSIDFEVHRFIKSFHFRGSDFDPCGLLIICAGGYSIPVRPNNWMDVWVKLHMEPGKKM